MTRLNRFAHLHAAGGVFGRGKLGGELLGSLKFGGAQGRLGLLGGLAGGHVLPARGKVGVFRLPEIMAQFVHQIGAVAHKGDVAACGKGELH